MPKFRCVRDILDYAVAKEHQAHDFYVALAQQVQDAERHEAIRNMAIDELQHAVRLEAIRAGEVAFDDEVGGLDIAETLSDAEPTAQMSYAELLVVADDPGKGGVSALCQSGRAVARPRMATDLAAPGPGRGPAQTETGNRIRLDRILTDARRTAPADVPPPERSACTFSR